MVRRYFLIPTHPKLFVFRLTGEHQRQSNAGNLLNEIKTDLAKNGQVLARLALNGKPGETLPRSHMNDGASQGDKISS
jgi:hypothetical protein